VSDEVSIDALTGGWSIAQRVKGHRHSTDDLLTGWYAAERAPTATRLLDLGAGIGSVGLLALWRAPADATLTAVEAQEVSFGLLVDNIQRNHLESRVRAIHSDLRQVRLCAPPDPGDASEPEPFFDLVTGSPPYWDVSQGVVPQDSQKAHARFELRGTVHDYALAAREHLAPPSPDRTTTSKFVLCFPTAQRERCLDALAAADLALLSMRDVVPRVGAAPLFTLFSAQLASAGTPPPVVEPAYVVRDADGLPTLEHVAARASFGIVDRERARSGSKV
jgi:tRNA1(Val) A37 N6-methylase TrmN6